MNVLKDDLFKNKYFVITFVILAIIIGIVWFMDYNSMESKCKRHVQGLGSFFSPGENKLRDLQIHTVSEPLIQDCIRRGGPQ